MNTDCEFENNICIHCGFTYPKQVKVTCKILSIKAVNNDTSLSDAYSFVLNDNSGNDTWYPDRYLIGNIIHNITTFLKIAYITKYLEAIKEDGCGCNKRKEWLNKKHKALHRKIKIYYRVINEIFKKTASLLRCKIKILLTRFTKKTTKLKS